MEFDTEGIGELIRQLKDVEKRFPATTERVLKKEARRVAKDLRGEVASRIEGHGRHDGGGSQGYLEKSFSPGKVLMTGDGFRVAVVTKAPHYHLVEEGHDIYTHLKKGRGRLVGHAEGKKIVAAYMARRSEHSQEIAQAILDEVLDEVS